MSTEDYPKASALYLNLELTVGLTSSSHFVLSRECEESHVVRKNFLLSSASPPPTPPSQGGCRVVAVILGIDCCYSLLCVGPHPEPVRDGSGRTRERTARMPRP
jgi:hypothetical protein